MGGFITTQETAKVEEAAKALDVALAPFLEIRVLDHEIDMPNIKGCIEISKRGLLSKRVIAHIRLYKDEKEELFELEFEDPIDEIIDAFIMLD